MKNYKYGYAKLLPLEQIAKKYCSTSTLENGIPLRIDFTPSLWIHTLDLMKISETPVKVDGFEMMQDIEFVHIVLPDGNRFVVPDKILTPYNRKNTPRAWKTVVCSCCGAHVVPANATKGANGKYVCNNCLEIKGYFTRNDNTHHKETTKGFSVGFELECVPYNEAGQAAMCDKRFGFIPTHDGSLPRNGVEFKSPIFKSLRGLRRMFRKFTEYADFSNRNCGQHINVGHTDYNSYVAEKIRSYKVFLFRPLNDYLSSHPADMERVCGRFFTTYADNMDASPYLDDHSSFINLSHDDRIEYRISKFVDADQYFELTNMWIEMTNALINWTDKVCTYNREQTRLSARKCGNKLVNIFIKYASGLATVQTSRK